MCRKYGQLMATVHCKCTVLGAQPVLIGSLETLVEIGGMREGMNKQSALVCRKALTNQLRAKPKTKQQQQQSLKTS